MVIELITFLSSFKSECKTIPDALGYVKSEGIPLREQGLRFKFFKLMKRFEWFETLLFVATLTLHFIMISELATEVIYQIWIPLTMPISKLCQNSSVQIILAVYSWITHCTTLIRFIFWLSGLLDRGQRWIDVFPWARGFCIGPWRLCPYAALAVNRFRLGKDRDFEIR